MKRIKWLSFIKHLLQEIHSIKLQLTQNVLSSHRLYLLLGREDDGQVTSLALAVRLALRPIPGDSGDVVAAAVEEIPVHGAGDGGCRLCGQFDHLGS